MKPRTSKPKTISRLLILHDVTSSALGLKLDGGSDYVGYRYFRPVTVPAVGSLVALSAVMRPSKWYLSWVVEVQQGATEFDTRALLESIEDGELCWWSNVQFLQMYGQRVTDTFGEYNVGLDRPQWRWTDRQHQLNSRFARMVHKDTIHRPNQITFEGLQVTCEIRKSFQDELAASRTFADWRKVTQMDLVAYVRQHTGRKEKRA